MSGAASLYRAATMDDLPAFETMLRAYLREQEDSGGTMQFTRRTLDFYRDLATFYIKGALFGIVVLANDNQGFALAGEAIGQSATDHTLGKVAWVWIAWVDPTHRKESNGLGMLLWGQPFLLELGFETAAMTVLESNPSGKALTLAIGSKPVEQIYHFTLKEESHGQRKHG